MTIHINYQHPHHPGVLLLHLPSLSGRSPGRILAVDGFPRTHRCSHNRISSGETNTLKCWWWWTMVVEVVTMRMMVEVLIKVFFDNIFTPLCLEILSQFDNSLPHADSSLPQAMIILCHPMPILSLPALPLRTLPHVFSSTLLIEAPCLLIQPQ